MKKYLLLIAALATTPAAADLYLGGWSYHLIADHDLVNQTHNIAAVEYKNYVGGYFKNSHRRDAGFFVYDFIRTSEEHFFTAGIMGGFVYGYREGEEPLTYGRITAILAPYVTFGNASVQPTILLLGEAVTFSFKVQY